MGSQSCPMRGEVEVEAVISRRICVSFTQRSKELVIAALSGMFSLVSVTVLASQSAFSPQ